MKKLLIIAILFTISLITFGQRRPNSSTIVVNQNITDLQAGNWKVFYSDGIGDIIELTLGANATVLTSNGPTSAPTFETPSSGFADPMTTRGDIIIRDATNTTNRLGIGANTFVLTSDGTDISWAASASGGAPVDATYITQTANGTLTNEQAMGALATGIVKNTTTTGVQSIAVAGDFPTLNQNTTGSAATLTTPRGIYGNDFDGSSALTQIIASTYGGTGNGFTKFSGATTSEKTYTLPNATTTILTTNAAVSETQGGTNQTTYTTGDILYASGSNTLSKLAAGTDGYVLTMGASVPDWAAASGSTPTRQSLTSGTSITFDGDNGTWASLTLAHNATLTFNDFSDFTKGQITVTQDATGSRTLAFAETITAVTSIEYDGGFELINPDASTTSVVKYTIDDTVLRISIEWHE